MKSKILILLSAICIALSFSACMPASAKNNEVNTDPQVYKCYQDENLIIYKISYNGKPSYVYLNTAGGIQ